MEDEIIWPWKINLLMEKVAEGIEDRRETYQTFKENYERYKIQIKGRPPELSSGKLSIVEDEKKVI